MRNLALKKDGNPSVNDIQQISKEFQISYERVSKYFYNLAMRSIKKKFQIGNNNHSKRSVPMGASSGKLCSRSPFRSENFSVEQICKLRKISEQYENNPPPHVIIELRREFLVPREKVQAYFVKRRQNYKLQEKVDDEEELNITL